MISLKKAKELYRESDKLKPIVDAYEDSDYYYFLENYEDERLKRISKIDGSMSRVFYWELPSIIKPVDRKEL